MHVHTHKRIRPYTPLQVFALLDEDNSGTVEWQEFVNAINALETGSVRGRNRTYSPHKNEAYR